MTAPPRRLTNQELVARSARRAQPTADTPAGEITEADITEGIASPQVVSAWARRMRSGEAVRETSAHISAGVHPTSAVAKTRRGAKAARRGRGTR